MRTQTRYPSLGELILFIVMAVWHFFYRNGWSLMLSVVCTYFSFGVIRMMGMLANSHHSIEYWAVFDWWWAPLIARLAQ
jgi:hypothetical protein